MPMWHITGTYFFMFPFPARLRFQSHMLCQDSGGLYLSLPVTPKDGIKSFNRIGFCLSQKKTTLGNFLSRVYYCFDEIPWPKAHGGRKALFDSPFHVMVHYQKAVRTGTQAGQDSGSKSGHRGQGGVLLIGLLPMAFSALRTQNYLSSDDTRCWAFPHWSLRKCLTGGSYGGPSSAEAAFSLMTSGLSSGPTKPASYRHQTHWSLKLDLYRNISLNCHQWSLWG